MDISAVNISVDINVDEDESTASGGEEIMEEGHDATTRNYSTSFKNGRKLPTQRVVNYLVPPTHQEEGSRDQKKITWNKYFGDKARSDFFGRSSWVSNKRNFLNQSDSIAEKVDLHSKKDSFATDFAFAPRRSSTKTKKAVVHHSEDSSTFSDSTLNTTCSTIEKGAPTSPRTRYIGNCVNSKINPRASLILRKRVSTELILKHQGMGDKMGSIFADSLKELPFVHTLDLTDNNLTDVGLRPIINAVISLSNLTDLNLSNNVVDGESSKALATYLSSPHCSLKRLILQSADVDDMECQMFVASLINNDNHTLRELDLSKNIIGKSENLNTVMPDLITGGEALADLLRSNACNLETLKLGWNMIRLDSAVELAQSLAGSEHLKYLDLSYNTLGKIGGEILGDSLISNNVLEYLNISNNSINSTACFTICVALEENNCLHTLILDGNPIGDLGLTMTSQIPLNVGGRVHVSTQKCNSKVKDSDDSKVDLGNVAGNYHLDMTRPFERAIMFKLLSISARNRSYNIENYTIASSKRKHAHKIKLKRDISGGKYDSLTQQMKDEVETLKNISRIAQNEELGEQLFLENDVDGGGSLDIDEVEAVVESLGLKVSRKIIEAALKKFDLDGGGVLELPEFLEFMRSQNNDAVARIRELTEGYTICNVKTPGKRYLPPKSGKTNFLIADNYIAAGAIVVSSEEHKNIMELVLKSEENQSGLLEHSIKGARLRAKEAVAVYHFMAAALLPPPVVLEKLLPYLVNYTEARLFLELSVQNDPVIIKRLRQTMGGCLDAILGHFNGWYSLNLSREHDRMCLVKLLEQSQANKEMMIAKSCFEKGITGDVSQLGDWSSFRNVVIDGQPSIITAEMFNPMAQKGIMHFDFSGADKPNEKASTISDQRLVNCLVQHKIVSGVGKAQTMTLLEEMKQECHIHFRGDGTFNNNIDETKAKKVQMHMLKFYAHLISRPSYFREAQIVEDINLDGKASHQSQLYDEEKGDTFDESDYDNSSDDEDDDADRESDPTGASHPSLQRETSVVKSSYSKSRRRNTRRHAVKKPSAPAIIEVKKNKFFKHIVKASVQSNKEKLSKEIRSMREEAAANNKFITCWKIVQLLFELFKHSWLRCRHIAAIMVHFFQGHIPRAKYFGSYRVELVVLLYHRLVDVQNFDLISKRLMPAEIACLYCRLGYLNLFNPMKPEGAHFLNISNREERILTKMLGALSALEPGENWIDETFQWELGMDPIPGWVLTQTWMTDEGMPPRGFLYVVYYSGEGRKLQDTEPNIAVRKSFFNLVGVDEDTFLRDECNAITAMKSIEISHGRREVSYIADRIYNKVEGRKCALDYKSLWRVFLTPFDSTSARIARGEKVLSVFNEIRVKSGGKNPYNLHVITAPKYSRRKDSTANTGKNN